MTQLIRSILVPTDLVAAAKKFHAEREAIGEESTALQEKMAAEQAKLQARYTAAENEMASAVYGAGLLPSGMPFGVDTRYVEEHGHAYLRVDAAAVPPHPMKAKMN